jgi:hypothetical protein
VPVPATIALSWTQAPGGSACIDRPALVHRIDATVGGHRLRGPGDPAETAIRGTVGPASDARGWLAVIEARRPDGTAFQRRLEHEGMDCRDLDEAIVLVVALMMDSAESEAPALRVASRPRPSSVTVGAGGAFAIGMLPGAAVGFGLTSEVRIGRFWPLDLWTDLWPTTEALQSGAGARFSAWTAGLGLCPLELGDASSSFLACAGATGGEIISSGVDLDVAVDHTRAYAQAEVRIGGRLRVAGPLFLAADLGLGVPLARDSYSYTQADGTVSEVFRTAPVVPLGHLALEVRGP